MKVMVVDSCYIVATVGNGIDVIVPFGVSEAVEQAVDQLKETGLNFHAWHEVNGWEEADRLLNNWLKEQIQELVKLIV